MTCKDPQEIMNEENEREKERVLFNAIMLLSEKTTSSMSKTLTLATWFTELNQTFRKYKYRPSIASECEIHLLVDKLNAPEKGTTTTS